jgi:DNA-binding response OmpR family regulator
MVHEILFTGKTVLVAEDDLETAEHVADLLTALGFETVLLATNLKQAQELIDRFEFDAALLDVNLRHGETTIELGWDLSADGIPIVFFSGFSPEDMARATRGHEFMEKPISLSRLKASLQRAVLRAPSLAHTFSKRKMASPEARQ